MLDDKSLLTIVKIYATVSGLCGMGQAFVGLFQRSHCPVPSYSDSLLVVAAPSMAMPWQNRLQQEGTGSGLVIKGR